MSTPPAPPKSSSAFPIAMVALVGCLVAAPVLVAVIGIAAAIAIPNFIRFQCRSKQAEAKVNLTGLFIAEKAFYGEYNFYTTDLQALNWQPDGSPLYLYGFAESGPDARDLPSGTVPPSDYDPTRNDTADTSIFSSSYYSTGRMRDLDGNALDPADLPQGSGVTSSGFTAGAVGDLSPNGYGMRTLDVWTIDESKLLSNPDNDCH